MSQKSLVDRIAEGEATLLGVDEICKRLDVSRATLDRWVRNGGNRMVQPTPEEVFGPNTAAHLAATLGTQLSDLAGASVDRYTTFPPPDIRIGNSPKWELETFKDWIRANMTDRENY